MIIHRYDGRFANQVIQYLLIKYYSIKYKNPTNFIRGNSQTFPSIIEYNNEIINKFNPDIIYQRHDAINYDEYNENILFKNFFGMNPLNFEIVNDEVAKNILPIKQIKHDFYDGDVICCLRGGDIITIGHELYPVVSSDFYIKTIKKYKFERVFILGELNTPKIINIANEVKRKIPNTTILPMKTVEEDFMTFFSCPNLIGSYSSFYWLAAFLSRKNYAIFPSGKLMDKLYYNKFIYENI